MASSGMTSQGDVDALIRTIRAHSFLNKQLQNICTINGLKATGVKMDLQNRIVNRGIGSRECTPILQQQPLPSPQFQPNLKPVFIPIFKSATLLLPLCETCSSPTTPPIQFLHQLGSLLSPFNASGYRTWLLPNSPPCRIQPALSFLISVADIPKQNKRKKANWGVAARPDITKSASDPRQFQHVRQSIQDTQKGGKNASHSVSYNGNRPSPAAPASGHANRTMPPYGQDNYNGAHPNQTGDYGNQYRTPQGYSSMNQQQISFLTFPGVPSLRKIGITFRESPFYKIEAYIGETRVLEPMQHHRNTVELLVRTQDQALLSRCGPGSGLRVMLFCAASDLGSQNIAFPQNSELKVNGGDVKANMRGLKRKPGSTRPVDLTDHLRLNPAHYNNRVTFTYALTMQERTQLLSGQKFHLVLCVCRVTSVAELVQCLEISRKIPRHVTVDDLRKKAADPDIVATSQKLSLKCPLSYMRLGLPCRGQACKHIQCFDATSYLQLQEQGPQWRCPICNREASYDDLAVDMYVKEILNNTSDDLDQVTIEPDARWHLGKDSPSRKSRPSFGESSALFGGDDDDDQDIDDDVIAIPDDGKVFSTPFTPARSLGTPGFITSRESSSAPKPSSGSKKRKAEVIDLTLDSDDDEPPRPAKKPLYGHNQIYTSGSIRPGHNTSYYS
ncbi:hypothetical protein MKZ38_006550 [Zalerion maritima]|uniref:Uncharacterized protein n=1 Tax=Zalerion maritima TaxID=339359 RepID=A0AAD5WXN3_9PEZI|nr:hypothetical protein MKZ38_006550 [Zalerion maritima]